MSKRLGLWLDERLGLSDAWARHFSRYYVPRNLNAWYFLGFLALLALILQVLSGIWLTMAYKPDSTLLPGTQVSVAFASIQHFTEAVPGGAVIRHMHTTGASLLFAVLYLHLFRGLLYGSYKKPRELLWLIGIVLFGVLLAESFFGQVLPWSQMAYWGAQVILHLVESLPLIGKPLANLIRGDYTLSGITLNRFFALHVIAVPLVLLGLLKLHLAALRKAGSSSPDGKEIRAETDLLTGLPADGVPLHPTYTVQHLIAATLFLAVFYAIVYLAPALGGYFIDELGSVPAQPFHTPDNIRPMWYFAPFYAMLRAIPAWGGSEIWGGLVVCAAWLALALLPWLDRSPLRSIRQRGWGYRLMLAILVVSFVGLGILGLLPPGDTPLLLARILIVGYFSFFAALPLRGKDRCAQRTDP